MNRMNVHHHEEAPRVHSNAGTSWLLLIGAILIASTVSSGFLPVDGDAGLGQVLAFSQDTISSIAAQIRGGIESSGL